MNPTSLTIDVAGTPVTITVSFSAVPAPVDTPAAPVDTSTPIPVTVSTTAPLMTAAWPLNQVATQYPIETRSLNSSWGDNQYTPKPIKDVFAGLFGTNHIHFDTTMPHNVVDSSKTPDIFTAVTINTNWGSDDASHVPCIGADIEGGDNADPASDRHILVLDTATKLLHELFAVTSRTPYTASFYRQWDTASPKPGALGRNSADAAGLPIWPLLLDYDEAASGFIGHALRFTINLSRANPNNGPFCLPACHASGQNWSSPAYMGMRLYLRADFDAPGLSVMNQTILKCLKTFGIVLADNGGSGYITGMMDSRWNGDELNALASLITLGDFIPVNSGAIVDSTGAAAQ